MDFAEVVVKNVDELVVVQDRDGSVRFVTPSLRTVLGRAEDEVLGATTEVLVAEPDATRVEAARQRVVRDGVGCRLTGRLLGAAGNHVAADLALRPLDEAPGTVLVARIHDREAVWVGLVERAESVRAGLSGLCEALVAGAADAGVDHHRLGTALGVSAEAVGERLRAYRPPGGP